MLRKLSFFLFPVVLFLAALAPVRAYAQKTIHVSVLPGSQYPTIQSGIDAASDGDTVSVFAAFYPGDIDFKGKAITVTAQDPTSANLPVIVGSSTGPAVTFDTGETSTSVLSYMVVENGGVYAKIGPPGVPAQGAILVSNSSPSILHNTLTQNICWSIYVNNGSPLIEDNEIDSTTGGRCVSNGGAAIYVAANDVENPAGATLIYGNLIQNNTQAGEDMGDDFSTGGAGIAAYASAIIQNNVIRDNASNASAGGGINVGSGPMVLILQNLIYGNSAGCGGGGIGLPQTDVPPEILLIANNTIVDNRSGPSYAVFFCAPSSQLFTVPFNAQTSSRQVVIVNNILSGSTADAAVNCAQTDPPTEAFQSIFDHNILRNAGGPFFSQYCIDVSAKYSNLSADPNFTDAANGDYSLAPGSPAIDAGNTSVFQLISEISTAQITTDIANNPRVVDATNKGYPIIDMGAYEYAGSVDATPTTLLLSFVAIVGSPRSLVATVKSALGTPTGTVTFSVDGAVIGSAAIDGSGTATLSKIVLQVGVHSLLASYPGQGSFTPAVAIVNIVDIDLIPTRVILTDSFPGQPPPPVGAPVTFTVSATADDGSVPTPITLTDLTTGTLLATLTPDARGIATFVVSTLTEGKHSIEAFYAGTKIYAASQDNDTIIIGGATTTVTLTCGSMTTLPVGATVSLVATVTSTGGTPTGNVSFTEPGAQLGSSALVNGVASYNATALPGYNLFTADFAQQNGFGASYATCGINAPPLTIASSAPQGSPAYSPITFTAAIAGTSIPAGKYTLTIGTNAPVAMTASADGASATYTTPGLAQGNYTVTAIFTPSSGATPYTADLTQIVTAAIGDFTLTGPSTLSTPTEGIATGTLTLTSIYNFFGTVALSCNLPLPTTYTCTITPSSVQLVINDVTAATVTLAPNNLRAANGPHSGASRIVLASLLPLTLLSLAGFGRRRRYTSLRGLICLVTLAIIATSTTACGTNVFYATTQPGSYPVTITGTGTTRGGTTPTTHTLKITLNLTP